MTKLRLFKYVVAVVFIAGVAMWCSKPSGLTARRRAVAERRQAKLRFNEMPANNNKAGLDIDVNEEKRKAKAEHLEQVRRGRKTTRSHREAHRKEDKRSKRLTTSKRKSRMTETHMRNRTKALIPLPRPLQLDQRPEKKDKSKKEAIGQRNDTRGLKGQPGRDRDSVKNVTKRPEKKAVDRERKIPARFDVDTGKDKRRRTLSPRDSKQNQVSLQRKQFNNSRH